MKGDQEVAVRSLFGRDTKQGIVELTIGPAVVQISSIETRRIAVMLLEAAEGADSDSLIYQWATGRLGVNEQMAAGIINDFRKLRAEQPSILAQVWDEPEPASPDGVDDEEAS